MAKDTKDKILKAATKLYTEKGFSGASISMIAKEAGINQSLIYHHVGSKEDLWIAVKKELFAGVYSKFSYLAQEYQTFEAFIDDIIEQRINLFKKDPRTVRFLMWQTLENNEVLIGGVTSSAKEWIDVLEGLKKKGQINKDYDIKIIFTHLMILSTDFLGDPLRFFRDKPKLIDEYIKMFKKNALLMFGA